MTPASPGFPYTLHAECFLSPWKPVPPWCPPWGKSSDLGPFGLLLLHLPSRASLLSLGCLTQLPAGCLSTHSFCHSPTEHPSEPGPGQGVGERGRASLFRPALTRRSDRCLPPFSPYIHRTSLTSPILSLQPVKAQRAGLCYPKDLN